MKATNKQTLFFSMDKLSKDALRKKNKQEKIREVQTLPGMKQHSFMSTYLIKVIDSMDKRVSTAVKISQ